MVSADIAHPTRRSTQVELKLVHRLGTIRHFRDNVWQLLTDSIWIARHKSKNER